MAVQEVFLLDSQRQIERGDVEPAVSGRTIALRNCTPVTAVACSSKTSRRPVARISIEDDTERNHGQLHHSLLLEQPVLCSC